MSPATPPPGPGSTFGHYLIESTVGVGGMGVVYLATDQRLGRRVALKMVLGHLAESPEFVERFQREAAALARLESPHVVQIFDHGVQDGVPFIATQYAAGGDLGKLLRERGPMPPALAAQLASQVADALGDAHRVGVVHRDVKPANVLLRDDRLDRLHVYLCDFGVAQTDGGGLTEPGSVPGTWNYLAPERIAGRPGTAASDLYAVGCLLWEALTGQPPYPGSPVETAMAHQQAPVPQLPGHDAFTQRANRVLAGTLAKEPEQRYPSASVLRDDLRSLAGIPTSPTRPDAADAALHSAPTMVGSRPLAAGPTPTPTPTPTPGGGVNRRLVWGAVAVAAVLAIGTGVAVGVAAGSDDEPTEARSSGAPTDPDPSDPGPSDPEPTGPETEPTASDPTETTPVEPDTSGAIRGDVNGDGFGDLTILTFDDLQVVASDGSALADPTTKRSIGIVGLSGDIDNDGASDVLKIQSSPPRMTVSLNVPGAATSPIVTPTNDLVFQSLDVQMSLGDVDDDGNLDLVLSTPLSETEYQIDVARGDGTGVFAKPVTFFSGDLAEGDIVVADVDRDGLADIVHVDENYDGQVARLLRSTGSAFEPTGETTPLDVGGFALAGLATADADGDGVDEVVSITGYGPKINVWSWNGSTFDQTPWFDNSGTSDDVEPISSTVISDLDGDGYDDVVTIALADNGSEATRAYLSDGTAYAPAPAFNRRLPDLGSYNLLDASVNN